MTNNKLYVNYLFLDGSYNFDNSVEIKKSKIYNPHILLFDKELYVLTFLTWSNLNKVLR